MDPMDPPKIRFENEGWQSSPYTRKPADPKIIRWAIRYSGGFIKDEKQANFVLMGFASVLIVISIFLLTNSRNVRGPSFEPDPVVSESARPL